MSMHSQGYVLRGSKLEHVAIAEEVLGRPLPAGAEVHHLNAVRTDNRHENLVICPSRAYHQLLHVRTRALDACGDPTKRKCVYCKSWDAPANMVARDKGPKGTEYRHRICHALAQSKRSSKYYLVHKEAILAKQRATKPWRKQDGGHTR